MYDSTHHKMATPVGENGCPRCGATFRSWGVPPTVCYCDEEDGQHLPALHGKQYPYYDTGLGEVLKSPRHRQQVMKQKGFIEVGGEMKHVLGRWDPEKPGPVCTVKEVAEKLQEIQHRMANDASYREYYERMSRRTG